MSKTPSSDLTYDFLEDVMSLQSDIRESLIKRANVVRIGPLVEYAGHDINEAAVRLEAFNSEAALLLSKTLSLKGISQTAQSLALRTAQPVEFSRSPQCPEELEDSRWIAFSHRLVDGALRAGIEPRFAKALVGTFEEMTSNVIEHSDDPASGIVGYCWKPGEFEYVVADSGIGVLQSLKKHSDYSWVLDSGQALEVAVRDGESRHGRNAHRGTGFHNLLKNIAFRNSLLRFRSGDHSYNIDGTTLPIVTKTQSCAPKLGFLISIVSFSSR
jgi:hypothetical protein